MNPAQQVQEKIAQLSTALLEAHPRIPVLLKEIHTHLRTDPEIVTLLKEEEIQVVVNGLKKQTNTEIATAILKSSSSKKSLKNITVSDL